MTGRVTGEEDIVQTYLAALADLVGARGLRDDCATLAPLPGHELVLKTDPVRAGVHFFADDDAADIAWKALAVNVSDLAAKGARPIAYLLALSFPEAPERAWMARFAGGLREAQDAFGMALIGGDTDRAPGPFSATVTVIGEVPSGRMVPRGGARAGDLIYVSGTLGEAALGLAVRRDGRPRGVPPGLRPVDAERALARYLRPRPRLELRAALRAHARAAMDLSDGLAKDLDRMCRASGTGAEVALGRLPLARGVADVVVKDETFLQQVVSAGDDYEVLAAVPPEAGDAFERLAAAGGVAVSQIGAMTTKPATGAATGGGAAVELVFDGGRRMVLAKPGYDHF